MVQIEFFSLNSQLFMDRILVERCYSAQFIDEVRMESIYMVTPEAIKNRMILTIAILIMNRAEKIMLTHKVAMAITFALRGIPLPLLKSLI